MTRLEKKKEFERLLNIPANSLKLPELQKTNTRLKSLTSLLLKEKILTTTNNKIAQSRLKEMQQEISKKSKLQTSSTKLPLKKPTVVPKIDQPLPPSEVKQFWSSKPGELLPVQTRGLPPSKTGGLLPSQIGQLMMGIHENPSQTPTEDEIIEKKVGKNYDPTKSIMREIEATYLPPKAPRAPAIKSAAPRDTVRQRIQKQKEARLEAEKTAKLQAQKKAQALQKAKEQGGAQETKFKQQLKQKAKSITEKQKQNILTAAATRKKKEAERKQEVEQQERESAEQTKVRLEKAKQEIQQEERRLEDERQRLAKDRENEENEKKLEAERIKKLEDEEKERQLQAAQEAEILAKDLEKKQQDLEKATEENKAQAEADLAEATKKIELAEQAEAERKAAAEKKIQEDQNAENERIAEVDQIINGGYRIVGLQENQAANKDKLYYLLERYPSSPKSIEVKTYNLQKRNFENKFIKYDNNKHNLKPKSTGGQIGSQIGSPMVNPIVQDKEIEQYIHDNKLTLSKIQQMISDILADRKTEQHILKTQAANSARVQEIKRLRSKEDKPIPQEIQKIYQLGEAPKPLGLGERPKGEWKHPEQGDTSPAGFDLRSRPPLPAKPLPKPMQRQPMAPEVQNLLRGGNALKPFRSGGIT